jgi:hypothetical protein
MKDEDLHLHFNYYSLQQRCLRCLYAMKKHFLENVDAESQMQPGFERKRAETGFNRYHQNTNHSQAQFLQETAFWSGTCGELVLGTLMTDPASLPDVEKMCPGGGKTSISRICRLSNVSLETAGQLMDQFIKRKGFEEIKTAGAFCRPVVTSWPIREGRHEEVD